MDVLLGMLLGTGLLVVILIALIIAALFQPRRNEPNSSKDMNSIKEQIEDAPKPKQRKQ